MNLGEYYLFVSKSDKALIRNDVHSFGVNEIGVFENAQKRKSLTLPLLEWKQM